MLVLQFSYKSDRAIRIVPVFSANYIVIPVLGGVICFGENLHALQWLGVSLILVGVLVLTLKRRTPGS
jgi:drug/metabolite transporter (DMT)-like permease